MLQRTSTRPWTTREDKDLCDGFLKRCPLYLIAEQLNRPVVELQHRLRYLAYGCPNLSEREFGQCKAILDGVWSSFAELSHITGIPEDTLRYVWYEVKRPTWSVLNPTLSRQMGWLLRER